MNRVALPLLLLAVSTTAPAATYRPTRADDPLPNGCLPRDCSLREAVIAANANPGRDRILLDLGLYKLSRQPGASADQNNGALWIQQ